MGARPVGLDLVRELGQRCVDCVLVERRDSATRRPLTELLAGQSIDLATQNPMLDRTVDDVVTLTEPEIAREEGVTSAYIYTLLRLPWLAPDITTAIVNGRQPQQLSAKFLMLRASRLPIDWVEQRTLLGSENFNGANRGDCSKKVNHEMPVERFSSRRAPRERAYLA